MKECPEKISFLVVTILAIAVFTTFLIGQTHEAQDPHFYQPTELSRLEPTTNKISSNSQSKNIISGSAQTLSELRRKRVESKNGDKLGSISDLIIDTQSGRVAYVVIATRGVLGIGKKEKAVPPSAVSTATTKRDVVSLDATQERWNRAPTFHKRQLAALNDPVQSQKINQYYQQQNTSLAGQSPSPAPPPPTGRTEGQMKLASELIGKKVINGNNQEVGKISDVLVDISQPETKPAFAILKPGSWVTDANKENSGKLFAVPVKLLRPSSDKGRLTLNINAEQFKQPQPLTLKSWSSAISSTEPVVYTYQSNAFHPQSAKPDNTRLNQQNQKPGAITSEHKSETEEDLQLTQNIRRTLERQDGLSTRWKNMKITSPNGRVMLHGPVSSQQEKNLIGQLAEQVAGAGKADNQLEVTNK